MGKKYIITESQERILTRLVERELGPEESVLVTNKNPFKYEEFKDARRVYSPELKDGDRFYKFDDSGYNRNNDDKLKEKIDDKTIRIGDKIVHVGVSEKTYPGDGFPIELSIGGQYTLLIDYKGSYKLDPKFHYGFSGAYETAEDFMAFEEKIKKKENKK